LAGIEAGAARMGSRLFTASFSSAKPFSGSDLPHLACASRLPSSRASGTIAKPPLLRGSAVASHLRMRSFWGDLILRREGVLRLPRVLILRCERPSSTGFLILRCERSEPRRRGRGLAQDKGPSLEGEDAGSLEDKGPSLEGRGSRLRRDLASAHFLAGVALRLTPARRAERSGVGSHRECAPGSLRHPCVRVRSTPLLWPNRHP
jgi:hypothetical protein